MNATTTERAGMVEGVPAYTWALATVLASAFAIVGVVALVTSLLYVAASGKPDLSVAVMPILVLLVGIVGLPLCRTALPRVRAREAAAGYTTVPLLAGALPLRDPHDGRVLIAAGVSMPRIYRVSLRPARRLAAVSTAGSAAGVVSAA